MRIIAEQWRGKKIEIGHIRGRRINHLAEIAYAIWNEIAYFSLDNALQLKTAVVHCLLYIQSWKCSPFRNEHANESLDQLKGLGNNV